eukprot:1448345-Prymnesium_polylepis.1
MDKAAANSAGPQNPAAVPVHARNPNGAGMNRGTVGAGVVVRRRLPGSAERGDLGLARSTRMVVPVGKIQGATRSPDEREDTQPEGHDRKLTNGKIDSSSVYRWALLTPAPPGCWHARGLAVAQELLLRL